MTKNEYKLRRYVTKFFDELTLYDDKENQHNYKDIMQACIEVFLEHETTYNAYNIYETFFMIYQITNEDKSEKTQNSVIYEQNTLLDLVKIMKEYEQNTGDLIEKQRDHFIHSVNVFLLGLAVYAQNKNYRDKFKDYVKRSPYTKYYRNEKDEVSNEEFFYRWGIAALFHDIGYPVEIIGKQLKKFINDGIRSISTSYKVDTAVDFKDFEEFNSIVKMDPNFADNYGKEYNEAKFLNLYKPTDIMAHKMVTDFQELDINEVTKHLNDFINIMGQHGFIDHGFFSSILVLNSYGYLIQKHEKNSDFFFYPIVDSATAILLHNYYRNVLHKKPFNLGKLIPHTSPLAFLLILCDELQEWNRQPFGVKDKQRSHVNEIDLHIDDDELDITYIVKKGSLGLGFSDDKKQLLDNLLGLTSIFSGGLIVKTNIESDNNIIREKTIAEIDSPSILFTNIEKLAKGIHEQYNNTIKRTYQYKKEHNEEIDDKLENSYKNMKTYDQLSPQFKLANIRQAKSITTKLSLIGCELAYKTDPRPEKIVKNIIHDGPAQTKQDKNGNITIKYNDDEKTTITIKTEDNTQNLYKDDEKLYRNIEIEDSNKKQVKTTEGEVLLKSDKGQILLEDTDGKILRKCKDSEILIKDEKGKIIIKDNKTNNEDKTTIIVEEYTKDDTKHTRISTYETFTKDELEDLSILEHEEWMEEKLGTGWIYGEEKDEVNLIHPYLIPWDELEEHVKDYDRDAVRNIPVLVDLIGLKIVRTKYRDLTHEMHNFYNGYDEDNEFDDLPDYIKYCNYKQADFLVKMLGELNYKIVSREEKGTPVNSLKEDDIDYLAEREHGAWYKERINLGWTYGAEKDEDKETNPNLVPWDELDFEHKEANRNTFRNLPNMCEKVGLKIIKG